MKTKIKIRLTALLLCLVMIFTVSCTLVQAQPKDQGTEEPTYPANGAEPIIPDTVTLYISGAVSQDLAIARYESERDIIMMDTATLRAEFIESFLQLKGIFTCEETDTTLKITRDNGATCTIDFVEDYIYYDNFDLFTALNSENYADILACNYLDSEGNPIYLKCINSKNVPGAPLYIDLAARNIPLDIYDGKKYMPFQTFNDLFLSPYSYNFAYNGENIFLFIAETLDPSLQENFYSGEPRLRSEAFAEFNAKEICLLLDVMYGLQDEHGIFNGFEDYFKRIGLWDDLKSTDSEKSTAALMSLTFGYFADLHSQVLSASPYTGAPGMDDFEFTIDQTLKNYFTTSSEIALARSEVMPDGVPAYEEIGNTAYVTFDSFEIEFPLRSLAYSEDSWKGSDTLALIIYAHQQITREDSPIENVVIDLSCNAGGKIDAAVYVVAWILGSCNLSTINPITDSYSTVTYKADVNLDGEFDEKDTIKDKNLYCLISPVSFSGGNLVPALLKESNRVTLLGGTTSGGACSLQYATAADGTAFRISSYHALAVVKNGSYQNIDRGVEPHYYLDKYESYYNREALTDYLNNMK